MVLRFHSHILLHPSFTSLSSYIGKSTVHGLAYRLHSLRHDGDLFGLPWKRGVHWFQFSALVRYVHGCFFLCIYVLRSPFNLYIAIFVTTSVTYLQVVEAKWEVLSAIFQSYQVHSLIVLGNFGVWIELNLFQYDPLLCKIEDFHYQVC